MTLPSERVVVAAPMSYAGSAGRIWKLSRLAEPAPARIALGTLAVVLIATTWLLVTAWYVLFGLLLVPYRLIRRGSRKRKREALQHRETLAVLERQKPRD